jgi:hypothetical protein
MFSVGSGSAVGASAHSLFYYCTALQSARRRRISLIEFRMRFFTVVRSEKREAPSGPATQDTSLRSAGFFTSPFTSNPARIYIQGLPEITGV